MSLEAKSLQTHLFFLSTPPPFFLLAFSSVRIELRVQRALTRAQHSPVVITRLLQLGPQVAPFINIKAVFCAISTYTEI